MARPLRLEFPGALYHITARGNERRAIVRDDDERHRFLTLLGRTVDVFRWTRPAYVLMDNHSHLLAETPEPTLSREVRQLKGLYGQGCNRRPGRVGHLFEGRCKSILVEQERHRLARCRSGVRNPVRAQRVERPEQGPWSTYRDTAGLTLALEWWEINWTLDQCSAARSRAQGL